MSNMSYCRFSNTLENLLDCYENMDSDLSDAEKVARFKLLKLCDQIADEYVFEGDPSYSKS